MITNHGVRSVLNATIVFPEVERFNEDVDDNSSRRTWIGTMRVY